MPYFFAYKKLSEKRAEFIANRVVIGNLKVKVMHATKSTDLVKIMIEDREHKIQLDGSTEQEIVLRIFCEDFVDHKFVESFEDGLSSKIALFEVVIE